MSALTVRPSFSASPTQFGNGTAKNKLQQLEEKAERSWWGKQLYLMPQGTLQVPRAARIKAYFSLDNLKAGWKESMDWFKPKDFGGKALAIVTLLGAWAIDLIGSPLSAGIYTASKLWFPVLNISGLGMSFHYGVHKAYETKYLAQQTAKEVGKEIKP